MPKSSMMHSWHMPHQLTIPPKICLLSLVQHLIWHSQVFDGVAADVCLRHAEEAVAILRWRAVHG